MYNGLTTADKGALLKAKECGGSTYSRWATIGDKWVRELTVNIDLALAQIAEMESKENKLLSEKASEKPCMTWNERINQMTVEEKAVWMQIYGSHFHDIAKAYAYKCSIDHDRSFDSAYRDKMMELLNSPYTEGETENG